MLFCVLLSVFAFVVFVMLIFIMLIFILDWCLTKAFGKDKYVPPCLQEPRDYDIQYDYYTTIDKTITVAYYTRPDGTFVIYDKYTFRIIAEMLPDGKWRNFYLEEK